jgi:hypothetical protein
MMKPTTSSDVRQRPPVFGWLAVEKRVALTYAAVWVIALAARQAGRPDLIRSPRLVLAHVWGRSRYETLSVLPLMVKRRSSKVKPTGK